ncbi:MAG: sulfatase-like hydrolase/transferase [Bryobacterales bacterium]|nr:sulfatase-like hydrolase/transferase [Bryobacterales bacterium]
MNRREFVSTSALGAAAIAAGSCRGGKLPNVVVCFTDQLRPFELGCYGNPHVRTPHIDRLAREGFRFEVGVTNSPVCSPARATLLSGQYARTCTGSIRNVGSIGAQRTRLPDPTLAEILAAAGYRTGHVGKWHVHVDPFLLGFDYAYYPVEIPHRYYGRAMREAVREGGELSSETGQDAVVEGFMPHAAGEQVRKWIRANRDRPFFLNYSVSLPHMPIGPGNLPQEYVDMYSRDDVVLRDNVYDEEGRLHRDEWWFKVYTKWDYFWRTRGGAPDAPGDALPDGFDLRDLTAYYWGAVSCTDDLVGDLILALEENGLADNTIVVLAADHGELLGNHGTYNKDRLYEEAIRVPMVFRYPDGFGHGATVDQVASNVDIAPTVLDACGLGVPAHMQGQSLLPVLTGNRRALDRSHCFIEAAGYQDVSYAMPYSMMGVRSPTHKYGIEVELDDRAVRNPAAAFHDLRADPFELKNLAGSGEQPETAAALRNTLLDWHRSTPWLEVADELPHL